MIQDTEGRLVIQDRDSQMLLHRARLSLEKGQTGPALSVLQSVRSEDEKQMHNIAYLLGWCYIQRRQWDDVMSALLPLLEECQSPYGQEIMLEREYMTISLLYLGLAAAKLAHYEDATQHLTVCLKILHDKRVRLPAVRIKALYSLAMTCVRRGFPTTAVQKYEHALRLCQHYNEEEALPHIYHGLCDAYRHIGNLDGSYAAGQEALRLYQQVGDRHMEEACIHNLLGRTRLLAGDYQAAGRHYEESLSIATRYDYPTTAMIDCAALADLRLAEKQLGEARHYCQLALQEMKRSDDAHMRGYTYHIIGRVSREDAWQTAGERRQQLLEEAVSWFEQARDQLAHTQAYPDMAETCSSLAQTLEELGRVQEAIDCWRAGYQVLSCRELPDRTT